MDEPKSPNRRIHVFSLALLGMVVLICLAHLLDVSSQPARARRSLLTNTETVLSLVGFNATAAYGSVPPRTPRQHAGHALPGSGGLTRENYSQPMVDGKPEYECTHTYYFPCTKTDREYGPPLELIRELKLSQEDQEMFHVLRRFKKQREEMAVNVPRDQRKIAFLFLTKGPIPLAPLWERFFKGHEGRFSIYVHTKPGFEYPANASSLFLGHTIRSEPVAWGSPTMVDAERRLLAAALADRANHRFVLLSESCIPVKSFDYIWDYLMGTRYSFVSSYANNRRVCAGRYDPHMQPVVYLNQWRKALQWFSATRRHVNMIIDDDQVHAKFQKYCRGDKWHHHCYADEHYIPTLMNLRDHGKIANRTITYVDFSASKEHPRTFYPTDVNPRLIRYITAPQGNNPRNAFTLPCSQKGSKRSCFLFARKFSPRCLPKLMALSEDVIGY